MTEWQRIRKRVSLIEHSCFLLIPVETSLISQWHFTSVESVICWCMTTSALFTTSAPLFSTMNVSRPNKHSTLSRNLGVVLYTTWVRASAITTSGSTKKLSSTTTSLKVETRNMLIKTKFATIKVFQMQAWVVIKTQSRPTWRQFPSLTTSNRWPIFNLEWLCVKLLIFASKTGRNDRLNSFLLILSLLYNKPVPYNQTNQCSRTT